MRTIDPASSPDPRPWVDFCIVLLVAGNETTTNVLTNAVFTLDERPEERRRLAAPVRV